MEWTQSPRFKAEMELINCVATKSWFFMPISTAVSTRKSSRDRYLNITRSSLTILRH